LGKRGRRAWEFTDFGSRLVRLWRAEIGKNRSYTNAIRRFGHGRVIKDFAVCRKENAVRN
jgi:hypothetical protein